MKTRRTASPYTHVVFYFDGRRPTWHTSQELTPPTNWPAWVLAWVALTVLWMPAMRGLAWVILWTAYATGQSTEPPPAYTAWAP